MKRAHLAFGLFIACAAAAGILYKAVAVPALDKRYAQTEYVQRIEQRLDYKIKMDRAKNLQERIWRLEEKYPRGRQPTEVRDECRQLHMELREINRELEQGK